MNLRQINYLMAVVEEGSFTRAAQRLSVAQPSLSQQVRALERELGGPLLERMPNGVQLTAAGRAFLPEARAAASHAARAADAARTMLGVPGRELEIGTVTSLAVGLLPQALARWHRRHAETAVFLHEFTHRRDLFAAVRGGLGDLGLGPRPSTWAGPIIRLGWEEFVIVLPSYDPLARTNGKHLALEQLADRDWVLLDPDHGLYELTQRACAKAGFVPRAAVRTGQVAAAAQLAAAGLGAWGGGRPNWPPRDWVRRCWGATRFQPGSMPPSSACALASCARWWRSRAAHGRPPPRSSSRSSGPCRCDLGHGAPSSSAEPLNE